MKFLWWNNIPNLTAWNSGQAKKVSLDEYQELLGVDKWGAELKEDSEVVLDE